MTDVPQLNSSMAPTGTVTVELSRIAPQVTRQLLHDACVMYHANRRVGTVKTKGRSEVAGSTRKLYRQKGTGRARAGNVRTPVRRGGGHAFAKRPKDWSYSLPRKALQTATRMALRLKVEASEVQVVDSFALSEPKTRNVAALLISAGLAGRTVLFVTEELNSDLVRASRNIPSVSVARRGDLNADLILRGGTLLVESAAWSALLASAE